MQTVSTRGSKRTETSRSKIVMVGLGIVLFVVGFILVVGAIPHNGSSELNSPTPSVNHSGPTHEVYLLLGLFVSLTGVVLATVGPAVGFVKRNTRD